MFHAISPIDGRYADKLAALQTCFSEFALMRARCQAELYYVLALDKANLFEPLTNDERARVEDCIHNFNDADYQRIKAIEHTTKHDVKACEIFLRERVQLRNENLLHFALTSEDINNLAYNILLKTYLADFQLPQYRRVLEKLADLAQRWRDIPFPSRTHGQKATPSTAGKELAVFINRILRVYEQLATFKFYGKLNGAVGNYSAMLSAFPDFDWLEFSHNFLESLGLNPNICTTQIEDHDTFAAYFNLTRQINNIVLDLDTDCWLYISNDLFFEKSNANEVGSSTMPHKVNPINFENSEGNLSISNSLLAMMSDKLCRSRMQRDLSDSTVQRNIGTALAHAYLALEETLRGLNKLQINRDKCVSDLENSPELLAEPIQTILKVAGVKDPYTLLKNMTRGQKTSHAELLQFIDTLDIATHFKTQIHQLDVTTYIGDAPRICDLVLNRLKQILNN